MQSLILNHEHDQQAQHDQQWEQWIKENNQEQKWVQHLNTQYHRLDLHLQNQIEQFIDDGKLKTSREASTYYARQWKEKSQLLKRNIQKETLDYHPINETTLFIATRDQVIEYKDEIEVINWSFEPSRQTCFVILRETQSQKKFECHDLRCEDVLNLLLTQVRAMEAVKESSSLSIVNCRLQMMQLVKLIGDPSVLPVEMSQ